MGMAMTKELLIRVPENLYIKAKKVCDKEYKSMSALIRELLLEKIGDSLTLKEIAIIERSRREYKEGHGVPWKTIKRG